MIGRFFNDRESLYTKLKIQERKRMAAIAEQARANVEARDKPLVGLELDAAELEKQRLEAEKTFSAHDWRHVPLTPERSREDLKKYDGSVHLDEDVARMHYRNIMG